LLEDYFHGFSFFFLESLIARQTRICWFFSCYERTIDGLVWMILRTIRQAELITYSLVGFVNDFHAEEIKKNRKICGYHALLQMQYFVSIMYMILL